MGILSLRHDLLLKQFMGEALSIPLCESLTICFCLFCFYWCQNKEFKSKCQWKNHGLKISCIMFVRAHCEAPRQRLTRPAAQVHKILVYASAVSKWVNVRQETVNPFCLVILQSRVYLKCAASVNWAKMEAMIVRRKTQSSSLHVFVPFAYSTMKHGLEKTRSLHIQPVTDKDPFYF